MKKRARALPVMALAIALVAGCSVAVLLLTRLPQPVAGPISAQLLQLAPYKVATLDLDLKDTSRSTNANGDYPELPWRALPATVWYPVDGSHHPLIVNSHGFSSLRLGATYLAQSLAALGYVVVAADFPLTNFFARGGPNIADVVNQPGDVSFLIDRMLAFNDDPAHPLHGRIDPTRIGASGISLGGMTSTMAGFDPKRMDSRIKAVASVAGPSMMFGAPWFAHRQLPFLMVATPTDAVVNYEDNALPIPRKVDGAILVTIANASHTGFAQPARFMQWLKNPDLIGCAIVMHNLNKPGWGSQAWHQSIGSSEDGIVDGGRPRICETNPLPQTMNPVYQHWLTELAVTSFFEAHFNADANVRQQRLNYLTKVMPAELSDVRVEQAQSIATTTTSTTQMADATTPHKP